MHLGQIDYLGIDSIENILRRLDTKIVPPPLANGSAAFGKAPPSRTGLTNGQAAEASPYARPKAPGLSTDNHMPVAPLRTVHRATLRIAARTYNDHAGIKTGQNYCFYASFWRGFGRLF